MSVILFTALELLNPSQDLSPLSLQPYLPLFFYIYPLLYLLNLDFLELSCIHAFAQTALFSLIWARFVLPVC